MDEERHSQYCAICWSPVFWDEVAQRTIYTCTCHTKGQFRQPMHSKKTEVPQVFYDAFKEKNGEK
jgi:hypothetical protein